MESRDKAHLQEMVAPYRVGRLRPVVSCRFSLDEVPAALEAIMAREAVGRWVVLPQGDRQ